MFVQPRTVKTVSHSTDSVTTASQLLVEGEWQSNHRRAWVWISNGDTTQTLSLALGVAAAADTGILVPAKTSVKIEGWQGAIYGYASGSTNIGIAIGYIDTVTAGTDIVMSSSSSSTKASVSSSSTLASVSSSSTGQSVSSSSSSTKASVSSSTEASGSSSSTTKHHQTSSSSSSTGD